MQRPALSIEYLPIDELTPYERNTRKHADADVDGIALSIERYGMNDPVGIWGERNIIVEGHGRVLACRKLGIQEIPCVRLDSLTEKERREYAIAHNATAEMSQWDYATGRRRRDGRAVFLQIRNGDPPDHTRVKMRMPPLPDRTRAGFLHPEPPTERTARPSDSNLQRPCFQRRTRRRDALRHIGRSSTRKE